MIFRHESDQRYLALQAVTEVLPHAWPNDAFRKAIKRLAR